MMLRLLIVLLGAALIVAAPASAATNYTYIAPGTATGITGDGGVVVYHNGGTGYLHSSAYGSVSIGAINRTAGIAMKGSTLVVAGSTSSSVGAQRWDGSANGTGAWTALPSSSTFSPACIGAASNNVWIGGWVQTTYQSAGRYKESSNSTTSLPLPTYPASSWHDNSTVNGMSDSGVYAGQARYTGSPSGGGSRQPMGGASLKGFDSFGSPVRQPASSFEASALGISRNSQYIVGWSWDPVLGGSYFHAQYWTMPTGGWVDGVDAVAVPYLPTHQYSAGKVASDNGVLAGYSMPSGAVADRIKRTCWFYDTAASSLFDIKQLLGWNGYDMSGWVLMDVTGISSDGRAICGNMLATTDAYFTGGSAGQYHAWKVTVPEPSTFAVLGLGLLGLIRRRRV